MRSIFGEAEGQPPWIRPRLTRGGTPPRRCGSRRQQLLEIAAQQLRNAALPRQNAADRAETGFYRRVILGTPIAIGRSGRIEPGSEPTMTIQGLITTTDVLRHTGQILSSFGLAAWLRCCKAILLRERTTFLECACRFT